MVNIIVVRTNLDQSSTGKVVKALYPRERVQNEAVVKIIGSLGLGIGRPALPSQVALLKWLVCALEVLEDEKYLAKFYDLLFSLLDLVTLRSVPLPPSSSPLPPPS